MPGQRASSAAISSASRGGGDLELAHGTGNSWTSAAGRLMPDRTVTRRRPGVSTERTVGRCCATHAQLSPSSALANRLPVLVPK